MKSQLPVTTLCFLVVLSTHVDAQGAYAAARHGGNYMHNYYLPPAPSSTPWAPAWSPQGDVIAVALAGSIWLVEPESGAANQITHYVSTAPTGYFNVYVRAIQHGVWSGPAVAITQDNDFGNDRLYFGRWDMHLSPAWMPNGEELLIVSNRNQPLGSGFVWRTPVRPGGIQDATPVLREQTLYRTRPDVSPDGTRFVYSSTSGTADQFSNLYVQPTGGGTPYKWTLYDYDAFHPRWSPDGQRLAFITNEHGLSQLVIQDVNGGEIQTVHISDQTYLRPTGRLHVRVSAEESLDTVRVHLQASDGKFYAPNDAYARVGVARDHLFHTTGEFEITLPAGPASLTMVKGFEYAPQTTEVEIVPNQTTSIRVALPRVFDMADLGWYNGSTHIHMNYGGNLRNTLQNMMMMSAAEDQDMVTVQIANKDNRILDYQFFESGGATHSQTHRNRLLVVGQEYRPPFYGHVFMLGLRNHLISPFTTGYLGTAIESLYPSNTDMLRKAKAQGATVGYVHPFSGERDPLDGSLGNGKGFMVDAVLGTTDALEWSVSNRAGFFPLYAVWNNGLKVTAVGGEDSISDLHRSKIVGSIRTYVCIDGSLTTDRWFQRLEDGYAFVSSGPLVDLRVNGRGPGETIAMAAAGDVEVTARMRSIVPLERVTLIFNGESVAEIPLSADRLSANARLTIRVEGSGWFHLRAAGKPAERFPLDVSYAQGFTNPVWVSVGGRPIRNRVSAEYGARWIDKLEEMALADPGWRSQDEIDHVMGQFGEARAMYEELAAEAGTQNPPVARQVNTIRSIESTWDACWNGSTN